MSTLAMHIPTLLLMLSTIAGFFALVIGIAVFSCEEAKHLDAWMERRRSRVPARPYDYEREVWS